MTTSVTWTKGQASRGWLSQRDNTHFEIFRLQQTCSIQRYVRIYQHRIHLFHNTSSNKVGQQFLQNISLFQTPSTDNKKGYVARTNRSLMIISTQPRNSTKNEFQQPQDDNQRQTLHKKIIDCDVKSKSAGQSTRRDLTQVRGKGVRGGGWMEKIKKAWVCGNRSGNTTFRYLIS